MILMNIRDFDQYPDWDRIQQVYPEAVYIGRSNLKMGLPASPLANPFHVGMHGTREQVIEKYRRWLWQRIKLGNSMVIEALLALEPHSRIVCWCHPKPCHGQVVIGAAKWVQEEEEAGRLKRAIVS